MRILMSDNTFVTFTYFESVSQICSFLFAYINLVWTFFFVGLWVRYTFLLICDLFIFLFLLQRVSLRFAEIATRDIVHFDAATDQLVQELTITYMRILLICAATDREIDHFILQRDIPHACIPRDISCRSLTLRSWITLDLRRGHARKTIDSLSLQHIVSYYCVLFGLFVTTFFCFELQNDWQSGRYQNLPRHFIRYESHYGKTGARYFEVSLLNRAFQLHFRPRRVKS